jgi:uncharacterized protein YbjQ (UPF0145 family)
MLRRFLNTKVLTSTTDKIHGHTIKDHCGFVTGVSPLISEAHDDMMAHTKLKGGNAVIGVRMLVADQHRTPPGGECIIYGTGVVVEKDVTSK